MTGLDPEHRIRQSLVTLLCPVISCLPTLLLRCSEEAQDQTTPRLEHSQGHATCRPRLVAPRNTLCEHRNLMKELEFN